MIERNDTAEIEALVDGRLPWTRVQEIMKAPKDAARFDQWVQILQKRVSWAEPILLPLTPRLFIVQKGSERIVKCVCGQEYGDYRVNWKLSALIYILHNVTLQAGLQLPLPAEVVRRREVD